MDLAVEAKHPAQPSCANPRTGSWGELVPSSLQESPVPVVWVVHLLPQTFQNFGRCHMVGRHWTQDSRPHGSWHVRTPDGNEEAEVGSGDQPSRGKRKAAGCKRNQRHSRAPAGVRSLSMHGEMQTQTITAGVARDRR